jgi:hypothetical protein
VRNEIVRSGRFAVELLCGGAKRASGLYAYGVAIHINLSVLAYGGGYFLRGLLDGFEQGFNNAVLVFSVPSRLDQFCGRMKDF